MDNGDVEGLEMQLQAQVFYIYFRGSDKFWRKTLNDINKSNSHFIILFHKIITLFIKIYNLKLNFFKKVCNFHYID
jgi:hypothetical protein